MDETANGRKREIITTLAVLIVIVVIVVSVAIANKKNAVAPTAAVASTTTTSSGSDSVASSSFKDGTYKATGSYDSPGGFESVTVSVTLHGGVVTASSVHSGANDPEAAEYQSMFISGYKQLVVGKKISSISLSRVSGSSLTSQGFNSAIQKIEAAARA